MEKNETKTILEIDLASYSDIARTLEENLDVYAVRAFEDQIQSFVDVGLEHVGLRREEVVLGSAGDNAILAFEDATSMYKFACAVQESVSAYNRQKTVASAQRWFRMGAATGPVLFLENERRIVGTTVARAVRLEAAARNSELVVDTATYDLLPEDLQVGFTKEEQIQGKRAEVFSARRYNLLPVEERPQVLQHQRPSVRLTAALLIASVCLVVAGLLLFASEKQSADPQMLVGSWDHDIRIEGGWQRIGVIEVTTANEGLQMIATDQQHLQEKYRIVQLKHLKFADKRWEFSASYQDGVQGHFKLTRTADRLSPIYEGTVTADVPDEPVYVHRLAKIP